MGNVIEKKVNIDVGFKADESGLDALSKRIESKLRELQENGKLDLQVSNIKNIDKLLGTFSKLNSALTSIKQEGRSAGEALKQAFGKVMSGDLAKATANFNKFGKQSLSFMNRLNGIGKDIGTKDVSNRVRNLAKDINGAFKEMGSKAPLDIDKLMGKSVQEQMNALTKSTMRFTTEWTKNMGTINVNPKVDVKPNVQTGEVKNDITKAVQNAAPDSVKTDVKVQVNPDVEVGRLKEALSEIYGGSKTSNMGQVLANNYKGIIADVQSGVKTTMEAMAKNQTINLKTLAGLEKSTKRAFEGYSGTHNAGSDLTKQYNDWLNQIDKIRSARRKMTEEEYQSLRTGGVAIQSRIAQLKEENVAVEQLNRQLEMYAQYQQRLNRLNGFLDPANTKNLLGTKYEDQIKQSIDRIKGSVGKFDLQIFNKEELAVETRYLDQMFASTERLVAKARDAQGQTAFGGSLEKQFASIERAAERIKALQQGIRTVGNGGLEIVDPTTIQKIEQYKTALDQLNAIRAKLQSKSTASITGDEINEWNKAREAVEKYQRELTQLLETSHKLATKGETKKMLGDTSDLKARTKEMEAYAQAMQHGSLVSSKMSSDMRTLTANINDGAGRIHSVTVKFDEATQSMTRFASGSKSTLTGWQQFTSQLTGKVKEFSSYMLTFVSFYDAIRVIKSGVKQVTEIDAALTELKKVTDETDASYSNFLNTASKTATAVGSTIRDIVSSTADYARLGYSMNDAADLAANTAKLMNVSEFENISDATDSMISIMQAFRSQMSGDIGKDSMQVIDMLNEVGRIIAQIVW